MININSGNVQRVVKELVTGKMSKHLLTPENWKTLSYVGKLTAYFIDRFSDELDWTFLVMYQEIPEALLDKYKDKLTGCCQEGQVHHTLSERMSTDAKVWCEEGIDEMSQLRAFTQNGGNIYKKIIDISTQEKRNKKIEALEKRIKKKAEKKLFGTVGVSIPTLAGAKDELYYELKNIWYGKAV